jgi:hypothetical protein
MMWLIKLFRSPSAFRHDPWGYLRNQIGHAYLVGGGLALLGFPLWVIALGYAAWEAGQWQWFRADLDDCLEDLAHVLLIAVAAHSLIWELVVVHALFLGAGFVWRKRW